VLAGRGTITDMPDLVSPTIVPGALSRSKQPVIAVDERALLRPWVADDAQAVAAAYTDPAIQQWHARSVDSIAEAEEMITGWQRGWIPPHRARARDR
jgi:RimJ/RimL family protein N-acetyltransferase